MTVWWCLFVQFSVPVGRPLMPSDVPRILAEIRGEPYRELAAPEAAEAEDAEEGSVEAQTEQEPNATEGSEELTEETRMPSLSGTSKNQRLASFVAMTTELLRSKPPPLPSLRALVAQLTATLGDVTTGITNGVKSKSLGGSTNEETTPGVARGSKKGNTKPTIGKPKWAGGSGDVASGDGLSRPDGWADWVKLVLKRSLRQPEVGAALLSSLTLLCRLGLFPSGGGRTAQTEVSRTPAGGRAGRTSGELRDQLETSLYCRLLYIHFLLMVRPGREQY